ncbi:MULTISPECIES: carbohydrate ABC transporter permease [Paenibacillus]|uniref:carbohydrate ABC transporter permease n=2 Tax=Paenibacillus TaxID=44249 RepID=UPI0010BA1659|nr:MULTISPECIES: sugar ABC transporter permease [Paenibacillus]GCL74287.1 sugar ABC transporter permease [Paenibacillus naphthalenovorans]
MITKYFQKISFILPAMMLLILLTGYPLLQVIQMSFYDYQNKSFPVFAGLSNYTTLILDSKFWDALSHTLVFTFSSVILDLIVGMTLAVLLNQSINLRVRGILRSILMFPWLFSSSVVAATWVLMLNPFGIINSTLHSIGFYDLSQIPWLSDERFALPALILANVWRGFPFVMLMLLAGLQTVSKDYKEAAEVDGAGALQTFIYIILPQMKGVILTVTILEIIWNFRSFDLVFLMTGGGPMNATEVLSTYVYNQAFRSLNFGYASAIALFMFLVMALTSIAYLKMALEKEVDP